MMRRIGPRIMAGPAATILLLTICALAQQRPREMFERARMLDESNQNLSEAIKLYDQVISHAKDQRQLAASAQYRIGMLYERLGRKAEAQRAFKAVVSQYPDQIDLARRAQIRIVSQGANGRKTEKPVVKQTGPSADGWYQETFTALTEQTFNSPVIDSVGHRLYVIHNNYREPRNDAERKRVDRQGLRYVYEPSVLIVIDTDANSLVKTIPLSAFITGIAFDPANNKLYATAQLNGHVKVIDTATSEQTMISVPGQPTTIAVNATTNRIYVTSQGFAGNDKLFVIDGATNAIAGPYNLDGVAGPLVVNSATNRIYAVAPPKTRVFNGADNSLVTDLTELHVIEADPVHNLIYAGPAIDDPRNIQVLDGNSHTLIASIGFTSRVYELAIVPNINRLCVALPADGQIVVVDTSLREEVCRLLVADFPQVLAVDQGTGRVYVCHTGPPPMIGVLDTRVLQGELPEEFSDTFDSPTLDPSWAATPLQGSYSLIASPGHLRLRYAEPSNSKRLLLMRRFRGDSWTLDVKASYFTGTSGGSRNVAFGVELGAPPIPGAFEKLGGRTPINAVYVVRSRGDWNGCCPGETKQIFVENGKVVSYNALPPDPADVYVWRIQRNGRTISVERSDDGINFTPAGSHTFGPRIERVIQFFGISYDSFANNDAYADFDYVRLTKTPPSHARFGFRSSSVAHRQDGFRLPCYF